MSLNGNPAHLRQVVTCSTVSKDPGILPFGVELAPIARVLPLPGFVRVGAFDVAHFLVKHPIIQTAKSRLCYDGAEVVGPAPHQWGQASNDGFHALSSRFPPFLSEPLPQVLERGLARRDQHFVP